MNEATQAAVGRFQVVTVGKSDAVLLDTATGSSWSLARDIDTLQLGWRPLEERWPEAMPGPERHAADRHSPMLASQAWWRPRFGPK